MPAGTESGSAAALIVSDDDLSKITEAIRHGRTIHSNLKKAVRYARGNFSAAHRHERCRVLTIREEDIGLLTDQLGDLQDLNMGIHLLGPSYTNKVLPQKARADLMDLRGVWLEEKGRKEREIYLLLQEKTGLGEKDEQMGKD